MQRDFTPQQARAWVEQEFNATIINGTIGKRIQAERDTIELAKALDMDKHIPNSFQAHQDLKSRLVQYAAQKE